MNNQKLNYLFIGLGILAVVSALLWYFYFSIYEIKIIAEPKELKINSQEVSQIKIVPINLLGKSVPFRKVPFNFSIIKNKELVFVSRDKTNENIFLVSAKDKAGKVKIEINTKFSLFPNIVEILIVPAENLKN